MLLSRTMSMSGWAVLLLPLVALSCAPVQESKPKSAYNFAARQRGIIEELEKGDVPVNEAVQNPPMIKAKKSDLGDDEPVIGVDINGEARAYPLTMMFGGGGIFELLNDTCGGEPIAPSW